MKLPFYVDLTGKVAAITGAGGVICSEFARAGGVRREGGAFGYQRGARGGLRGGDR